MIASIRVSFILYSLRRGRLMRLISYRTAPPLCLADFRSLSMAGRRHKTDWCEFFFRSHGCYHGDKCRHAHYASELRQLPADCQPTNKREWYWSSTRLDWSTRPTYGRADPPRPPRPPQPPQHLADQHRKRMLNAGRPGVMDAVEASSTVMSVW